MKTKVKKEESVMQELRTIRENLSDHIKNMTPDQLKEYISKQKTLLSTPKGNG
ncbi:MAG: hypothetical protein WBB36_11125 [Chitinophagales bacterium]